MLKQALEGQSSAILFAIVVVVGILRLYEVVSQCEI
jgi:hypothetical protein